MKNFSQTNGANLPEPEKPEKIEKDSLIGVRFTVIRYEDTMSEQFGANTKIYLLIPDDKYVDGYTKTGEPIYIPQTIYGGRKLNEQLHGMDLKEDFPFVATLRRNEYNAHEFCDAGFISSEMSSEEVPF